MIESDYPVYVSRPTMKSMRNEYNIYTDRIVLRCRFPFLLKTFVIKKEDIVSIVAERSHKLRWTFSVLKLDLADMFEHVSLRRRSGLFKELRFTPDNPEEFVERAREILHLK